MEGPAAPAGALGRGEDAGAGEADRAHGADRGRPGRPDAHHGVALRGQAVAHEWLMLKAEAFGSFSVSVVE